MISENKIYEIARHVDSIRNLLGIVTTEDNIDTPKRIAKMFVKELFANVNKDPMEDLLPDMTCFFPANVPETPIVVKGIKFTSMCSHHWLPFTGYADIEYIPERRVLGLSKLPRAVEWFSKRPQMQEILTQDIGRFLIEIARPKYLKVTLRDVRHSCVEARGVKSACSVDTVFEYHDSGWEKVD